MVAGGHQTSASETLLDHVGCGVPGESDRFHGFDGVMLPNEKPLARIQFSAECKPPVPARKAMFIVSGLPRTVQPVPAG